MRLLNGSRLSADFPVTNGSHRLPHLPTSELKGITPLRNPSCHAGRRSFLHAQQQRSLPMAIEQCKERLCFESAVVISDYVILDA
jgi:hypothetical protein